MKGFHANRDCIFWKKSSPMKFLVDWQRRCLETRRSTSSSQVSSCRQTSTECRSTAECRTGAPGPQVPLSCHTEVLPSNTHTCPFILPLFLMRKDLLTYRVREHIKSHTLESGSAVPPWSRTLTAFGRCSL